MALSLIRSGSHRVNPEFKTACFTEISVKFLNFARTEARSLWKMLLKRITSKKKRMEERKSCGQKYIKKKRNKKNAANGIDKKGKIMLVDNFGAVTQDVNKLTLNHRPITQPKRDEELLVKDAVGISSDADYRRIGKFIVKKFMVMSHINAVGNGTIDLKKYDHCAFESDIYSYYSKSVIYNLCSSMKYCPTPSYGGYLTGCCEHATDSSYKLPDSTTTKKRMLLETLSLAGTDCRRAGMQLSANVLLMGVSSIGLVALVVSKTWSAATTTITNIKENSLNLTAKLHTLKTKKNERNELDLKKKKPIQIEKRNGAITEKANHCIYTKETVKQGIYKTRSLSNHTSALACLGIAKSKVKRLATPHYSIQQTDNAFATAKTGAGDPIKVVSHALKTNKNERDELGLKEKPLQIDKRNGVITEKANHCIYTKEAVKQGIYKTRSLSNHTSAFACLGIAKSKVKRLATPHYDIQQTDNAFEPAKTSEGDPIEVLSHAQKRYANSNKRFKKRFKNKSKKFK